MATEYGGRGDPRRTMELLWGTRERPSRGPKPALSLKRIVRAAIEVADVEGLAALSMRRIADKLGFTTMALYRYVPGKAELLDLMVDAVDAETPPLDDVAGGWRAKLELEAREEWALYHRHPWALQVAVGRPVLGPNGLASYESALRAVSDIGLTEREMVGVFHLVYNYVRGAARVSIDALQAEAQTGVSNERWWSERDQYWDAFVDFSRYPTLTRVAEAGAYDVFEEDGDLCGHAGLFGDFEFGLQLVLDGIEALVNERSGQSSRGSS